MTVEKFMEIDLTEYKYKPTLTKVKGRKAYAYMMDFGTVDTEVTTIKQKYMGNKKIEESGTGLLYIWQVYLFGKYFVYGRTLKQLKALMSHLYKKLELGYMRRLVIYCHNLEYDWQFISSCFKKFEFFATDKRAILYAYAWGIEFRCSYKLSNMSLEKFAETMNVKHQKQSGAEFDYDVIRTPDTKMTFKEMWYCYCDVVGLYESIVTLMLHDNDNIVTIPMTSTGYVRRDCMRAMKTNPKNRKIFEKMKLNPHTYQLCKDAFRGGNTHANRHAAGKIMENVVSYDIASSYPSCMLYEKYMMDKLIKIDIEDADDIIDLINNDNGLLMDVSFTNIRTTHPIPYIPISKCTELTMDKMNNDNGRVLRADRLRMTINDDDFLIIMKQYEFDEMIIHEAFYSKEDYLPKELREVVADYFIKKTTLKGIEGEEYLYTKSKNKLNSTYGMTVQDPVHKIIKFKDDQWIEEEADIQDSLDKFYNNMNSFLSYQWGVQVTSKARARLQEAIDIIVDNGGTIIYVDTDSVKFTYDPVIMSKIEQINDRINTIAAASDVTCVAYTKDNEKQVMGLWDNETVKYDNNAYSKFRTYGAKKYAVEYMKKGERHFEITVAGLNKKKGAKELGCIENFLLGVTIQNSGRTRSIYDDNNEVHYVEVNGVSYPVQRNIAILPTTYTLGVTNEYAALADNINEGCYE